MTCGYVCPQCEGKGVLDSGESCDYCSNPIDIKVNPQTTNETSNHAGEREA